MIRAAVSTILKNTKINVIASAKWRIMACNDNMLPIINLLWNYNNKYYFRASEKKNGRKHLQSYASSIRIRAPNFSMLLSIALGFNYLIQSTAHNTCLRFIPSKKKVIVSPGERNSRPSNVVAQPGLEGKKRSSPAPPTIFAEKPSEGLFIISSTSIVAYFFFFIGIVGNELVCNLKYQNVIVRWKLAFVSVIYRCK